MIKLKDLIAAPISSGNIVTILDIGSSKIVCLIANVTAQQISIIGSGCHSASGFKNGNITDTKSAKSAIIAAVDQAEKAAGITVEKVILALNGNKIRSHYLKPSMNLKKQKVSSRDVKQLIAKDVEDIINYDPRIAVNQVTVDSTDQGIRVQADITYIPFNINERMTFDFDKNNAVVN